MAVEAEAEAHMSRHDRSLSDLSDGDLESTRRGKSILVVYHGQSVQGAFRTRHDHTYRYTERCSSNRL